MPHAGLTSFLCIEHSHFFKYFPLALSFDSKANQTFRWDYKASLKSTSPFCISSYAADQFFPQFTWHYRISLSFKDMETDNYCLTLTLRPTLRHGLSRQEDLYTMDSNLFPKLWLPVTHGIQWMASPPFLPQESLDKSLLTRANTLFHNHPASFKSS